MNGELRFENWDDGVICGRYCMPGEENVNKIL